MSRMEQFRAVVEPEDPALVADSLTFGTAFVLHEAVDYEDEG